jgi:anti-anti-sigma factor
LFVKLHTPPKAGRDAHDLADEVLHTMEQHFTKRVVLEMDELQLLHSGLIGQLVQLQRKIASDGGTLRVCGLSDAGRAALHATRLDRQLGCCTDRTEAVMGQRPNQPR